LETAQLEEAIAPIRRRVAGKKIFVGGGESRILATAELFATTLGMELVGIKAHNVDRFVEDFIDQPGLDGVRVSVAVRSAPLSSNRLFLLIFTTR